MDYIDQMLADLGHDSELVIRRDVKNGNTFRGYIYGPGPMPDELLSVESPYVELVIGQLNEQAEEWLLEQAA